MSETDHSLRREEIAAYLLGSLEAAEAADLERHLEGCEECRGELAWLRPAVQVLPESVARVDAPPALRARLMSEVQADAKRARAPAGNAGAGDGEGSLLGRLVGAGLGRSGGLRPATGLAVAALVVALVAGYAIRGDRSGAGDSTVAAGTAPGVTAKIVSNGDSGTLQLANVRGIPSDKVLQAWVQRGDKVVSAHSLFVPDSKGKATATIPDMQGVEVVMVTAEPRGGSPQPTSKPIVSVAMPD